MAEITVYETGRIVNRCRPIGTLLQQLTDRGKDTGSWLVSTAGKLKKWLTPGKRMKVTFNESPPHDDYEYNRQKNIYQDEINRILDKISKSGYESLTKKEKEILFKQGKK